MNRDRFFQALSGLDDRYVAEAIRYAPGDASGASERIVKMKARRIITIALAAVLILALGVTGYATGFFSMLTRQPDPEETFRINWSENPSGYIEWSAAKLAVTFPETAESKEIEFRPGWLPYELPSQLRGCHPWQDLSADTWFQRLSSEDLAFADGPQSVPAYRDMMQPLLIETYSMSMFNNGGAMLLLYYTPEEITEEHWDEQNVDVMYFHATQHFDAVPEYNMPERTIGENIVVLSNAEGGWVIRLAGEISMDEMLEVARNLEVRETGKTMSYEDFENHYLFIDGGVG